MWESDCSKSPCSPSKLPLGGVRIAPRPACHPECSTYMSVIPSAARPRQQTTEAEGPALEIAASPVPPTSWSAVVRASSPAHPRDLPGAPSLAQFHRGKGGKAGTSTLSSREQLVRVNRRPKPRDPHWKLPLPCTADLLVGCSAGVLARASSRPAPEHFHCLRVPHCAIYDCGCLQPSRAFPGAPHLDFEMWESTNLNPSLFNQAHPRGAPPKLRLGGISHTSTLSSRAPVIARFSGRKTLAPVARLGFRSRSKPPAPAGGVRKSPSRPKHHDQSNDPR